MKLARSVFTLNTTRARKSNYTQHVTCTNCNYLNMKCAQTVMNLNLKHAPTADTIIRRAQATVTFDHDTCTQQ